MKVLLTHRPGGAYGYISEGWLNAFRNKGHDARRWDGNIASWNEFGPDLYIGCSGHKQPIPNKRNAKVAIHVNPYGPVDLGGINEPEPAKQWTIKQSPDAVFGYGFESDRILWSYWDEKLNIPWVPMPTAVDSVVFKQTKALNEREFDVVYLGGRWDYKALTIDKYLKPILDNPSINSSLYGWGDWWPGYSKGILPEDQASDFLNSGKIAPCISEQHTQTRGLDIPERCWKVAACGALAIHDSVGPMKQHFNNCVVATSPADMMEKVIYYKNNDSERIALAEKQRHEVLNNHTYHHRLSVLLKSLGFEDEANQML